MLRWTWFHSGSFSLAADISSCLPSKDVHVTQHVRCCVTFTSLEIDKFAQRIASVLHSNIKHKHFLTSNGLCFKCANTVYIKNRDLFESKHVLDCVSIVKTVGEREMNEDTVYVL